MTQLLFETEGNPLPGDARPGRLRMRDGRHVRYARFAATGRPLRGTVVLLQGRNECIEKYFETISDLAARGFGVLAFDWRGQGGSDRLLTDPERGYVDSFDEYVSDFEQIFDEVALPDCRAPFYVLAHSTGALVALLAAPLMVNRVRRMVLTAPLLKFRSTRLSNATLGRLTGAMFAVGLGSRYLGGGPRRGEEAFEGNKITSDRKRFLRNQAILSTHPQLALGGPTVAWLRAALDAIGRVEDRDFLARIQTPILMIAAGADRVVSTPSIESLSQRLRSGALLTVDGAKHELLQEADRCREQALAAFDSFVPGSDTSPM